MNQLQMNCFLIKTFQLTGKIGIGKHICLIKFESFEKLKSTGYEKWKIQGKSTRKRAKERRKLIPGNLSSLHSILFICYEINAMKQITFIEFM